ncbi:MAG: aminoglycoside phosphotransferase [Leptospiraceae bacterium]|nr:MAG: aminoglycoside phosphotransferase [Leptospiraceae bacterium]
MTDLEFKEVLEKWLSYKFQKECKIINIIPLSGGACQENSLLEIKFLDNEEIQKFVYRSDKGSALFASLPREYEFRVAQLAYQYGVKTPKPYFLEETGEVTGKKFYIMEALKGTTDVRYITKDPSFNAVRPIFLEELARNLALIHSITIDNENIDFLLKIYNREFPFHPAKFAIEEMKQEIEKLDEPHPAMYLVLNWLEGNIPQNELITLVHGDFRTGNFMVSEKGLEGILDWEFAHLGNPDEDISWFCLRDWRFGQIKKEAGGIAEREEFYELYEKYSKRKIDPKSILFWEVMGNLRWAVGTIGQAERHLQGKTRGIELAAIGRRTAEMEYEMMRLIENAI